jgi:NitT/TauT family transport system substrate-binding protein
MAACNRSARRGLLALAAFTGALASSAAFAQAPAADCPGGLRKINIGVAVSPPNVVHTTPYVAKALGLFAKHCVEANIVQFDGGAVGTSLTAVAQGSAISNLTAAAIAQGIRAKQIWGFAPRPPQSYVVAEGVKSFEDLKGKRLSAAGGVGGYNWIMGREVLKKAGLKVEDATFLSQGTAGRLPGLLTGQLDGVVLHPEDVFLAQQKKPGTHVLISLVDLLPNVTFNSYGASTDWIAKDRPLLRDTIAAMIEANRAIYREKEKVIPILMQASEKPRDAVEFAYDFLTKNCIWAVNTGFNKERSEWTTTNDVANGDIEASKKPTFEQLVDLDFGRDAVAAAGGPVTIGSCKD